MRRWKGEKEEEQHEGRQGKERNRRQNHSRDPEPNEEKRMTRTQRYLNPQKQETNKQKPDFQRKDLKCTHDNPQPKKQKSEKKKKMKEEEQRKE